MGRSMTLEGSTLELGMLPVISGHQQNFDDQTEEETPMVERRELLEEDKRNRNHLALDLTKIDVKMHSKEESTKMKSILTPHQLVGH